MFIPWLMPQALLFTNHPPSIPIIYYLPCLPNIQTFFFPRSHSLYRSTSSAVDLLMGFPHTLPSNLIIAHSLNMAEPSDNTYFNCFIYLLRHSTQLSYPCIRYSIHSVNTQQTSEAVHLYRPNSRPLLFSPYHCLTIIQKVPV